MTIHEVSKLTFAVIYQKTGEESVPEPALVISFYSDVIEIQQEEIKILLNPETVPELVKVLRRFPKAKV